MTKAAPETSGQVSKRQKISQLKTVVNQLKGIAEAVNTPVEENEFEVFGKNVGLQLKGMPLQLALEAQQHIQTYLNRIRLQHLVSHGNSNSIRSATLPLSSPFSDSRSTSSILDSGSSTTRDTTPEHQDFYTQQSINDFEVYSKDTSQNFNLFPEGAARPPDDPEVIECDSQQMTQFRPPNNIILAALTDALHTVNS